MALRRTALVSAVLALVLLPAVLGLASAATGQTSQRSLRSVEHVRLDCRSDIGRREVTLFGNGTVRLREGLGGEERIWLHELSAAEVDDYLARLSRDTRNETEPDYGTVEGPWVERCSLALALDPSAPAELYEFGRYDTVSLDLRRALSVALELGNLVDSTLPPEGSPRLPRDYEAQVGDVLQRLDGRRFRVVGFTWDGQGIELAGLEDPLTVYLPKDDLRDQFVVVESKGRR